MKTTYTPIDLAFQQAYRIAYFFLKLSWRVFRRDTQGAQVMLWVNGEILLVRSSYRNEFTFPGGYINPNEKAATAASRELAEEVNINVSESSMKLRKKIENHENGRQSIDYIFNCVLKKYPTFSVDNREIIEAVFVSPATALKFPLHYTVRDLIEPVA